MPYATTTFTAVAGDLTYGPLTFTVISADEVKVTVGGVTETAFTYDASGGTITFDASVTFTGGEIIVAQRSTEIEDPRVSYNAGSPILANDLNVSNTQLLNAIQDLNDEDSNLDVEIDANRDRIDDLESDLATETAAREAADITLQDNINTETQARIDGLAQEAANSQFADQQLQDNIDAEAATRASADTTLQSNIDAVDTKATTALSNGNLNRLIIDAHSTEITDLQAITNTNATNIFTQGNQITGLGAQVGINITDIATNASDIAALQGDGGTYATDIAQNTADIATNLASINANAGTLIVQGNQLVSVASVATTASTDASLAVSEAGAATAAVSTLNQFVGAVSPTGASVQDVVSGYRSIVSSYYDPGTVNSVQVLPAETWVGLVPDVYLDEQHELDTMAPEVTYDASIGRWYLAGTQPGTHCLARVLYEVTPDEDESQLDIQLNFLTNPTTFATGLFTFNVGAVATVMSQGADIPYTDEVLISFFVGDTLFGPDKDNAGSFTAQAKSSVGADFEVLSITLNTYF